MTKTQYQKIIAKITAQQKKIAKERDNLCEIIDEAEMLRDDCYEAWELLDQAKDALSKLV